MQGHGVPSSIPGPISRAWSRVDIELCLCTCPDSASAEALARALVGEGLAACVNLLPGIRSIYRWKGELCSEGEVLLLIKTRADRREALGARIQQLHPYEVPELLAFPASGGLADYLGWVVRESDPDAPAPVGVEPYNR